MDEAIERTLSQLWKGSKKWHLLAYHYWVIPVNIVVTFFMMSAVFTAGVPDHHCTVSDNSSLPRKQNGQPESCLIYSNLTHDNNTEKCSNWTYPDKDYGITIVTEWDLVCDYDYLGELSQSFFIMGAIVATLLVTPLADNFGRKLVYLILNGLLVIFGVATAYSVNYIMFTVFRVLSGIVGYACLLISIVATVELFPKDLRAFAGQIMFMWWSIGMMFLDLLAYFIRNWRHLQLAVALMPVITIIDIWLIPESVPWLLSKGKVEQAEEIVKKAAAFNGTTLPEHPFKVDAEVKEEKELGRMTLFREPILRRITLILSILWFVNTLVYYGLSLSAAVLAGDRFLNFFLMALVEIPATFCAMFLMESRAGRRISISSFHGLAGISLIVLVFIPPVTENGTDLTPLTVFSTLVGKFSITASFDVVAQYTLELYPTCLRNTGFGTATFTGPVAGILAPFAVYLARFVPWAPGVIFGIMSLLVGILALLLPETRGRPLPQTVEDMNEWQLQSFTCGSLNRRKQNKSINVNSNEEKEQATTLL
ncbi:organic cation transporter protein-like isoform X1 [Tubulanus polymorphus]|uniref:organic cation transporter protein-like isoform X1 n=1 Tax=Tubulanus polymorphus TaxID=672921 RepID=UPI003DA6B1C3